PLVLLTTVHVLYLTNASGQLLVRCSYLTSLCARIVLNPREGCTGRNCFQQAAQTVAICSKSLVQVIHGLTRINGRWRTGAVAVYALYQTAWQLWVLMQRFAQTNSTFKLKSVETTAHINQCPVFSETVTARTIKLLQRQSGRVGDAVTTSTGGRLKVNRYTL